MRPTCRYMTCFAFDLPFFSWLIWGSWASDQALWLESMPFCSNSRKLQEFCMSVFKLRTLKSSQSRQQFRCSEKVLQLSNAMQRVSRVGIMPSGSRNQTAAAADRLQYGKFLERHTGARQLTEVLFCPAVHRALRVSSSLPYWLLPRQFQPL